MAGSGRRLALEAAFLAALAVAAGLAELSTGQIVGVMALGWGLTALVEIASWRLAARRALSSWERQEPASGVASPALGADGRLPGSDASPAPSESERAAPLAGTEQQGIGAGEAAMAAKADSEQRAPLPPIEKGAQADSTAADAAQQSPESQEPRPSRRWFRRSRRGEDASERAAEERSPPRHVRLIPRPSGEREANTDESVLRRTGERVEEK